MCTINELSSNKTFKTTDLDKLQLNYKCTEAETSFIQTHDFSKNLLKIKTHKKLEYIYNSKLQLKL